MHKFEKIWWSFIKLGFITSSIPPPNFDVFQFSDNNLKVLWRSLEQGSPSMASSPAINTTTTT